MYDGTTAAPKHHARGRAFVALLTIGLLTLATGAAAWSSTGEASGSGQSSGRDGDKVKICHRTAAETNPYRIPPVDSAGAANAHMDHTGPIFGQQAPGQKWGDIIEPFTFRGQDFPGLNWTAEGQEIWKNGCAVPPVDVCENIDGDQAEPPDGTVVDENGDCVPPPVECEGEQVPDESGECVDPPVECEGEQVPDESGECVDPPVECEGEQVPDENGECVDPPVECEGEQVPDENGECVDPPVECEGEQVPDENGECVDPPVECEGEQVPDENGDCAPDGSGGTTPPGPGAGPGPGSGGTVVAGAQATARGANAGPLSGAGSSAAGPAVPGAVDAGLAPEAPGSSSMLLATVLVGFGVMLMTAAGLLGRGGRRRSAHLG